MRQILASRPAPAILAAVSVVAVALVGTAIAGPSAAISVLTGSQVKKTAKKQANKQITKRAPGLSVANANALEGKPASAFAGSTSEPYREIGTPGEPGFQSGWENAGGGFSTAAFYKDPLGVVHLKGNLSNATDETTAFTLPPGYRPSQNLFMPAAGAPSPVAANLVVETDGDAIPTCAGAGSCIAGIDGLTFRAG